MDCLKEGSTSAHSQLVHDQEDLYLGQAWMWEQLYTEWYGDAKLVEYFTYNLRTSWDRGHKMRS